MDLSPIPLPYGKTYHLFLSFCQEDEEIAFSLLQELENKYQLKCLYHLRDFKPGVHVTENILDGIEKSMKIVYLVSQKFKESQLCKMETLYGITASHKQCENSLIPVLLEPIEMPRELQTINYVDGTLDGTDKACKIYKACLFGANESCILPNVIPFQDVSNGMPLRVIRRVEKTVWCIPVTRFSEDMTKRKRVKDEARSRQRETLLSNITWKYLRENYKTLKVLPLIRSTEEVVILNYDTDPCKKFCIFALKRRIEDEDQLQIEADSIILGFIYRNQTLLANWFGLEDFKYDRHNTYFQKKCICQYLEPSLLSDLFSDN
nr:uncharacterized protein LOC105328572 isoform X3 [Crassostrea gigas]